MGNNFMKLCTAAAAIGALLVGAFTQVGDNSVPMPTPAETHDTVANVAELQEFLAQRQEALNGVLASLQDMKNKSDATHERLAELVDLVSDWADEGQVKFVSLEASVEANAKTAYSLEDRIAALEAEVERLKKQCEETRCKCNQPTVGQAAKAPEPIYQGPVYQSVSSGYGSTGSSVRTSGSVVSYQTYPTVGNTVSYGSTGTGYYSQPVVNTASSYQTFTQAPTPVVVTETTTTQTECYTDPVTGQTVCPANGQPTAASTGRGLFGRIFKGRR